MKKTYIIPEITIHKLEVMNIIASSPVVPTSDKYADDSEVLSRRRGIWDDDDEDDW